MAENKDDTFLVCKGGFNNANYWKNAFVILSTEEEDGKKAKVGFSEKDLYFYPSRGNAADFVRTKDGWSGTISMRTLDLNVTEETYSFTRDDSSYGETGNKVIMGNVIKDQTFYMPDYEKFSINRMNLEMSYRYHDFSIQLSGRGERFSYFFCEISSKQDFEKSIFKIVDKKWKRAVKKKKRELGRRLEKKGEKTKPKI